MFNSVESVSDAARALDDSIESLLGEPDPQLDPEASAPSGPRIDLSGLDDADPSPAAHDGETADPVDSVHSSAPLDQILSSLRRRLRGVPIGSCTSERVALVLDVTQLVSLERDALLAESPDDEQAVVARTALVGLLLRDLGAVRADLAELGLPECALSESWVRELNAELGQLVAQKIGKGDEYELASILSNLKAKHLLVPMAALNAANRSGGGDAIGFDDAADEMRAVSRQALEDSGRPGARLYDSLQTSWAVWPTGRRLTFVAASLPILILMGFVAANFVSAEKSTVEVLDYSDFAGVSRYIASGYRSEGGRGGLLVGRIHPEFLRLGFEQQIEAATEMKPALAEIGVHDVMLYDQKGKLHLQLASGEIRRPRRPPESLAPASLEKVSPDLEKRMQPGYAWRVGAQGEGEVDGEGTSPAATSSAEAPDAP